MHWVFHREGRPIEYKRWRRKLREAGERAGIPIGAKVPGGKITHDLRRAAVMRFERAGVPRSVARSITGHKTESTYLRYGIVREIDQREALAKVAAAKPSAMRRKTILHARRG